MGQICRSEKYRAVVVVVLSVITGSGDDQRPVLVGICGGAGVGDIEFGDLGCGRSIVTVLGPSASEAEIDDVGALSAAQTMPAMMSVANPGPSSETTLPNNSFASGATPITPMPLSAAAIMPATRDPWLNRSGNV